MSNIGKRALRDLATVLDGDDWHAEGNSVYGGAYDVGDSVCYDHIASCESVNGESPLADFIAAANPATVLALLDELEAKDKSISFLKDQLAQLANFNPDWDKLEAATYSLREHMAELTTARKRIAELEAREVVLPSTQDVHPLGPQSAKIFCEFHRSIVNRCADEIRKVGVKVSIKGN
ncbi:TPA: ead/Ea22-like family protein [Enterobacter hormaechei]|uniref:ead/Ea22-like family protein n=1 Tax=Enterobacter cloacae complex sp. 357B1 TaxID=3395827 RepID=UPI003CE862D2|nr:ead/Ea22-like family protein [Enterobacter hormaechei]